jgi:hypothetical protein
MGDTIRSPDTCYTERYMGLPHENAPGYEVSSVMAHAGKLYGDLLIVHGLLDENVHFRHTARLLNTLNRGVYAASRLRHGIGLVDGNVQFRRTARLVVLY